MGCNTKVKEHSLANYFTQSWKENSWIHTFSKGINAMGKENSLTQE